MERSRPDEWGLQSLEPSLRGSRQVPRLTTTPTPQEPHQETLLEMAWRILRRRLVLIIQAILFVAVAAYVYSATSEKQYTSSASILFRSATDGVTGTDTGYVDPSREAATNENLLSLGVVADRTAEAFGGRVNAATISESIEIVSTPESDIMEVAATTPDPRLSSQIANRYVTAFISFRRESAVTRLESAVARARQALAGLSEPQRAGAEGTALRERINQLETAASLQTGDAEPVQPATPSSEPSAPKPLRNGILGAMLGAVLGFALAAIRERWDRAVYSVEELERLYGRPVLAQIPRTPGLRLKRAVSPRSGEAEAFRMLRASLKYVSVNTELRSLLISSARPGEGKTTIARRLAETMAMMGDRVVLVEADMYRPRTADGVSVSEEGGLSGVLVGLEDLSSALEDVVLEGPDGDERVFALLPRGILPPNPSELLESARMAEVMAELEANFDLVIVDSPPLAVLSDALTLVGHVSGVIAVSALGKSQRDAVQEFTRLMGLSNGELLGVVANFAPSPNRDAGHYYLQQK